MVSENTRLGQQAKRPVFEICPVFRAERFWDFECCTPIDEARGGVGGDSLEIREQQTVAGMSVADQEDVLFVVGTRRDFNIVESDVVSRHYAINGGAKWARDLLSPSCLEAVDVTVNEHLDLCRWSRPEEVLTKNRRCCANTAMNTRAVVSDDAETESNVC